MRILSVVGARPNFIKIAPVVTELRRVPGVELCLVHSGQHYDQKPSGRFFEELSLARTCTVFRGWRCSRLETSGTFGYLDFLCLMDHARLVLTDSGGVQEETTVLGVPCLTLRENTERPVTVEQGTNQLVGTDPQRIIEAARFSIEQHFSHGTPTAAVGRQSGAANCRDPACAGPSFRDSRELGPAYFVANDEVVACMGSKLVSGERQ
jgi:UDP-N-acetylglucosamine 2-epimerase